MISEEGENTMAKTKVICFTNNKGGSGKTTTCSNVGFGLRELGKKVLMIDGDMQLNSPFLCLTKIQCLHMHRVTKICMKQSSDRMI